MNIEIAPKTEDETEDKPILLRDCSPGHLVELQDGRFALVIEGHDVVEDYTDGGLAAVWIKHGADGPGARICGDEAYDMERGEGPERIARILGKLVVTL